MWAYGRSQTVFLEQRNRGSPRVHLDLAKDPAPKAEARRDIPVAWTPAGITLRARGSPERQIEHAAGEVVRLPDRCNQLKVADALPKRHLELVGIDHPAECVTLPLSVKRGGRAP